MSNVEKVLGGDLSVELSTAEFKEVNLKLVKAIAASKEDQQKQYMILLFNLGVSVDMADKEKLVTCMRAVAALLRDIPYSKEIALRLKEWNTWAKAYRHLVPSYESLRDIEFDWQNA